MFAVQDFRSRKILYTTKFLVQQFWVQNNLLVDYNKILVEKKLAPQKLSPKSMVKIGSVTADMDKCHQNKCCQDKCHPDILHLIKMTSETYL